MCMFLGGINKARPSLCWLYMISFGDAGVEVLFVSEEAVFNGTKAIRGGIPLVFPQV